MIAHDQTSVFEATSLTKKFGDTTALNSVTLSLGAHRVIGLIGRNGGGKTTLIQHMIGLYLPTEGMWIQYCGLLVQNISFITASILVLGVLGILSGAKIGFVSEEDISLRILCVLGWTVALIPILQWWQFKYDLYGSQRTRGWIWGMAFLLLGMILACAIAGFAALMRNLYPNLALTYEVPILSVCFILLQWFLLARLKRYYATQDLV